tara:strand:- start:1076 stop:1927 length:852 start_codon:yes stop_codon:yes gene_type:complete
MSFTMISFDVGIKNLAYCLFDCNRDTGSCKIKQWEVINLISDEIGTCSYCASLGKNTLGKWNKNGTYFCKRHADKSKWMIPDSKWCNLEKTKNIQLQELGKETWPSETMPVKKAEILQKLVEYRDNNYLEVTRPPKARDADVTDIAKAVMNKLDPRLNNEKIDIVLVENQIGTIAVRMKTLQGMLYQYFVMRHQDCKITAVSSINKLKLANINTSGYADRKKQGIYLANEVLVKLLPENHSEWTRKLSTNKKKDDLADAFLQGMWYLKERVKLANPIFAIKED